MELSTCLDATGAAKDEDGNSIMKHFWDLKDEDIKAMLDNTDWCQANHQYFRGGGFDYGNEKNTPLL